MDLVYYADPEIPVNFNGFVHFYIDDYKFDSIWRHSQTSLERLKRFAGIITPDFSTYQDMPRAENLQHLQNARVRLLAR